jgi:hypothetical protein
MKGKMIFLAAVVALAGCASNQPTVVSKNTDLLRVGQEPQGYPKSFIRKTDGFCVRVTDSWVKDEYKGTTIWLKHSDIISVQCPN